MEWTTGEEFRKGASDMTDFIVKYLDNIRDRKVVPDVSPGYLRPLIPEHAPEEPETWDDVMSDIERVIMPGVTHWQSPKFYAFYPASHSYPSMLADMLCNGLASIGFTWMASPACTELEVVMMDWLGELIGLPKEFLFKENRGGGGVIQTTASESTLMSLLSAKEKYFKSISVTSAAEKAMLTAKMVGYASSESHSSVERAFLIGGIEGRLLKTDEMGSLRGETIREAIEKDLEKGLIPIYVCATLGTTNMCSFDNLREIGRIASQYKIWLHVDAAYAGSGFLCEEFRYLMKGVEYANSFNFNPHKWMLVNFDCSALWMKDTKDLSGAFKIDPLYLKHTQQDNGMPDYRHWQIPLGRRFRSLKIWFVLRLYGVSGLQKFIRGHVSLAKLFKELVMKDDRFEVVAPVVMGLVCFRLKGEKEKTEELLRLLNASGEIFLVPAFSFKGYFLRLAVCSRFSTEDDIKLAWREIQKQTDAMNELE